MRKLRLWGILTLVMVAIIVVFQNTQSVVTRFLFVTVSMPNAAQIAIIFLLGFAVGLMTALGVSLKARGSGAAGKVG